MTNLPLGTRVLFTRHLYRRTQPANDKMRKWWTPEAWPGQSEPEPHQGIIVGTRTITNGYTDYDSVYQAAWVIEKTISVYLVAYDMRKAPVYVLPEHVQPELSESVAAA